MWEFYEKESKIKRKKFITVTLLQDVQYFYINSVRLKANLANTDQLRYIGNVIIKSTS